MQVLGSVLAVVSGGFRKNFSSRDSEGNTFEGNNIKRGTERKKSIVRLKKSGTDDVEEKKFVCYLRIMHF